MDVSAVEIIPEEIPHPHFIESNTSGITLEELKRTCIVPSFRDNTLTISHQNFAENVLGAAMDYFNGETFGELECRVSHPINGRIPTALHKKATELTDEEKTIYYQRLAWIAKVSSCTRNIDGQEIHLTIGGVRAYSEDKLYNRPSALKFKIFVGWQVRVCSNLMLQTDGFSGTIDCMTSADINQKALELFSRFNPEKDNNLNALAQLQDTRLTEDQFCHIIGRMRLLQALPVAQQREIPQFLLGDQVINESTRQYVVNSSFGRKKPGNDGTISTFDLMQLLNEAVKSSYIDKWLERNVNCTEFATGIRKALRHQDTEGYDWFLN
jgi:hypothetical protein